MEDSCRHTWQKTCIKEDYGNNMMSSVAFSLVFFFFLGLVNKEISLEWFEWIRYTLYNEKVSECFLKWIDSKELSRMATESIQTNELICKYFLIHFQQLLLINSIQQLCCDTFAEWHEFIRNHMNEIKSIFKLIWNRWSRWWN